MSVKRVRGKDANRLDIALKDIGNNILKVGWVSGKQYPNSSMTTAQVAAVSEFGSPKNNIPPRPIIRPTIIREKNNWQTIALHESKKILNGQSSSQATLELLGNIAAGDMRKTITRIHEPPLKRETVLARERTYSGKRKTRGARSQQIKQRLESSTLWKPLVFTKNLLNSCTFSVESK